MRRDPRTLLTSALLAAAALGATSACGAQTDDVDVTSSATATSPGTSTTSSTSESGARMTEGISQPVVLLRNGGIGGLKDRVEVRPDGTMELTSKGKAPVIRQLSEAQLAALVHAIQDADLPSQGAGRTEPTRSDELTYTITAQGQTFRTTETAVPNAMRPLVDELVTLFSAPAPTP